MTKSEIENEQQFDPARVRALDRKSPFGVLIALIAILGVTQAQAYSAGQTACRTWTDLRASDRAAPEMDWLQGYMMGAFDNNAVLAKHKNEYSNQKLFAAIDQHCTQSPGDSLITAARELEAHLIKAFSQPGHP